jgi:hypothetical protein
MLGSARSRRRCRRGFLPNCQNLESRNLLSGMISMDALTQSIPAAVEARTSARAHKFQGSVVAQLPTLPDKSVSTIPANGDVNPYAAAVVPVGFPAGGLLHPGDILVSNFNASSDLQGTGSTIVNIAPNGTQSVFYQGPTGLGVASALGVSKGGFVVVGNIPVTYDSDGNVQSVGQGSLIILNRSGHQVADITNSNLIDGPWGMAINDQGSKAQVFVSNVLNGTVTRINLKLPKTGNKVVVKNMVQIASGYSQEPDPAVFWLGPTGLAFNATKDLLYVASTEDNTIFSVPNAAKTTDGTGTGNIVYQDPAHLRGPLGLALAPNGDLLTTNGDGVNPDPTQASELVEFTPSGEFVGQFSLDATQGAAFGVALNVSKNVLEVATVNDVTNTLDERFIPF